MLKMGVYVPGMGVSLTERGSARMVYLRYEALGGVEWEMGCVIGLSGC